MDINGLQSIMIVAGITTVAIVMARYSIEAVFNTMHFFMIRFQSKNQK